MPQTTIDQVYRDYNLMGIPGSGEHEPVKAEIRALLKQIQNSGGLAVTRNTLAALNLVTPPTENYMGIVLDDPDPTNNGYYSRVAAAWVWERGFPDSVAVLQNIGGTANAITADMADGVSPSDVQLIILPDPPGTNTSNVVTIAINGAATQSVKAASGGNLALGDIIDGVGTMFFRVGNEWRQLISSSDTATFDHQGDWSAVVTYTNGQIVTGSNGYWYQLKNVASSLNDNPVSGGSGNWLAIFTGVGGVPDGSITPPKLDASLASGFLDIIGTFAHPADPSTLARPLVSRFYEGRVSLFDFMTAPEMADYQALAGALDHTTAAQNMLDSGEAIVQFPEGLLSLQGSTGLTASVSGQLIEGTGALKSYLNTPTTGSPIDILRVANSRVRVTNLLFRPGRSGDKPLYLYSGECEIDHNRFLAAAAGLGVMITASDTNPAAAFVSGAYSHWIHHNMCGASGAFHPASFVTTAGTSGGQNDNRYEHNRVFCDRPFFLHAGGGIVVRGNKLQSATGTSGVKVGVGVDCQDVVGVHIGENYLEKFTTGINIRTNAREIYDMGNHWDNVTNQVLSAAGAERARRVTFENPIQDFGYTANAQSKTPTPDVNRILIFGSGGSRTGCIIGAGAKDGQVIVAVGGNANTVEIVSSTTVRFNANAASATFGNGSGNIMAMTLVWNAGASRWFEVSRTVYA